MKGVKIMKRQQMIIKSISSSVKHFSKKCSKPSLSWLSPVSVVICRERPEIEI